MRYDSCNKD